MSYENTLNLIFSNEVIMESLEALFMEEAEKSNPIIKDQDDATLGQQYRAYCAAQLIIKDTFFRLRSLKGAENASHSIKFK